MRDPSEMHKRMRSRNIVLLAILLGLALLFAVVTYVKFGGAG